MRACLPLLSEFLIRRRIHKAAADQQRADGLRWYDSLAHELTRLLPAHHLSLIVTKAQIFHKSDDNSKYLGPALQSLCRWRVQVRPTKATAKLGAAEQVPLWMGEFMSRPTLQPETSVPGAFHFAILRSGVLDVQTNT